MRSEYIIVLVLAGALGGAGLMKLVQKPRPVETVSAAKQDPPVVPGPPAVMPPAPPAAPPVPAAQPVEKPAPAPAPALDRPRVRSTATPRFIARPPLFAAAKPSPFSPPQQIAAAPPSAVTTPPAAAPAPAPAVQEPVKPPAPVVPAPVPPAEPVTPPSPPARVEPEPAVSAAPPTPAPPSQPPTVTLSSGRLIPVRLVDGLSSERNAPGDTFTATLDQELVADGFVIAERGARAEGRVLAVNHGGRTKGAPELVIELTHINTSDGQRVPVMTDSFSKQMAPTRSDDATKVAAGAIIGAAVGAMAAGGKGAAIGAGVGAGAGTADAMLTHKPISLPSETRITFRLNAPVTLTEHR